MKWLIGIACFLFVVLAGCGIETVIQDKVEDTVLANAYGASRNLHLSDLFPDTSDGSEARNRDTDKYYWCLDNATLDDYVLARNAIVENGYTDNAVREEYFDSWKSYTAEKGDYLVYLLYSYDSLQFVIGTVADYEQVINGEEVEE